MRFWTRENCHSYFKITSFPPSLLIPPYEDDKEYKTNNRPPDEASLEPFVITPEVGDQQDQGRGNICEVSRIF